MFRNLSKLVILLFLIALDFESLAADSYNTSYEMEGRESKVLTRRKRFLTFPDGSSFQLVFCTQTHGYLQIGDIVWFGTTAALAWELPSDPALFHMFKKFEKGDPGLRRQDNKHVVYIDEYGKILSMMPFPKKRIMVNPAFAKRSVDETIRLRDEQKTFAIKELHETNKNRSFLLYIDGENAKFHREGRMSFYAKLEKFFEALGWKGKECVLRLLCENGSIKEEQGTFLEEIIRATFTLPSSEETTSELHEYDQAFRSKSDCAKLYPECQDPRLNILKSQ